MPQPSRRSQWIAAIAANAAGALVFVMVYLHPEGLRAPAWVAYAAGSGFIFAGLSLLAALIGVAWLQGWLALAVATSLLAVSGWVAFGPGERACSFSLSFVGGIASEAVCRGAFGLGAILVGLFVVLIVHRMLTGKSEA